MDKEKVNRIRQNYNENWVRSHRNFPFSVAVMYLYMEEAPVAVLGELYNTLSQQAKKNDLVTQVMPYYLARKKNDAHFKTEEKIKDFVLNDTSGRAHSFLSLQGKDYVLLDFWASWCGPCRRSTPTIINLLDTYRQHNFKVISVSADTDGEKWKEAIVKDKMKWYHLSDLKGTNSGFMQEKYIYSFPTYVLVSPAGVILSKPDTIERVEEVLKQIFTKEQKD